MISLTTNRDGSAIDINATANGLPVYLDNFALIQLASRDEARRHRLIAVFNNGADLLFSMANAVELVGPKGDGATQIKEMLDAIGPHWFPADLDTYRVCQRELGGIPTSKACVADDLLRTYFSVRVSEVKPGAGRIIDLSGSFFKLGKFMEWLAPYRDSLMKRSDAFDAALIDAVTKHHTEATRDPEWLNRNLPELPYDENKPCAFTRHNLQRQLVLEAKQYTLKKGDGLDFSHAVIGAAYGSFATMDRQWKRRIESLPKPNRLARVYYQPELDNFVTDLEVALATYNSSREGR